MKIRKMFRFENAHVVRGCATRRCSRSIHGHSYKAELIFSSVRLDRGQMVYDFGFTKGVIKAFIDSFDHSITLWENDDPEYLKDMKRWSERWVQLPVNPSAEQYARVFFLLIDRVLKQTEMVNEEFGVTLDRVVVHETETGYDEADRMDAYSSELGSIDLRRIKFSDRIKEEWQNPRMFEELMEGKRFVNPHTL